jgi:hypothetical protein
MIPRRPFRACLRTAALVAVVLLCAVRAQPADAIIGGQPAAPGYLGYVTFVGALIGDGTALYCTGALVAPSVVLTAAHCAVLLTNTTLPSWAFTVGTGRVDLSDTTTGQVLGVSNVVMYPTWNEITRRGDVALLQLAQPSSASTIPIASASDASWAYQPDTSTVVAGWGRTGPSSSLSSQLNWLDLNVQKDNFCWRQFAPLYDETSMFCASQPGTTASACNGDSGAPTVAMSPSGDYKVIGVASLQVNDSCTPPNLFARVSAVSPWLASQIAFLQATAPPPQDPASPPPAAPGQAPLVPGDASGPARKPPWLRTRPSDGKPGKLAKLEFWPGANSGRLRVQVRVINRGVVVYSKVTRYFQPIPRVWTLPWRVPRTLTHSVRFCMSATLLASDQSSAPSCSTLRIKRSGAPSG